jgi:hypothetical protein
LDIGIIVCWLCSFIGGRVWSCRLKVIHSLALDKIYSGDIVYLLKSKSKIMPEEKEIKTSADEGEIKISTNELENETQVVIEVEKTKETYSVEIRKDYQTRFLIRKDGDKIEIEKWLLVPDESGDTTWDFLTIYEE